jgi:hypothetical protein
MNKFEALLHTPVSRRRALVAGSAGAVVLAAAAATREIAPLFAQEEDPVKNTKVIEAKPGTWIHPMTSTGDVWSYGVTLRVPGNLSQESLSDQGNVGEVFINGSNVIGSEYGLDIQTNDKYINDYKGNGARAAAWLTTGKGDFIKLVTIDGDKETTLATIQASDTGFAGVLLPDYETKFGIRIARVNETKPVKIAFGPLAQQDMEKAKANSNIVDAAGPEISTTAPVYTIDQAPSGVFFRARSGNRLWSPAVLPSLRKTGFASPPGTPEYTNNGNPGELIIKRQQKPVVEFGVKVDPTYYNDYRDGADTQPAIWIHNRYLGADSSPTPIRVQLIDDNGQVITKDINGKDVKAEVVTDQAGYGGIRLPNVRTTMRIRLVQMEQTTDQTDVEIQIGPEHPADRNKPTTIDAGQFYTSHTTRLPEIVQRSSIQ